MLIKIRSNSIVNTTISGSGWYKIKSGRYALKRVGDKIQEFDWYEKYINIIFNKLNLKH
jgi:hypothetical protein